MKLYFYDIIIIKHRKSYHTSLGLSPYSELIVYINETKCPPVGRCIPFGLSVVPDVYKIYNGSFASTETHSAGSPKACSQLMSVTGSSTDFKTLFL